MWARAALAAFLSLLLCIYKPAVGYETNRQIPSSQKLVLYPFVEQIEICKISEYPKSALRISGGGSLYVGGSYIRQLIGSPNPFWAFFKNRYPRFLMDVNRKCRQCQSAEFLYAEFEQSQRCATLIFNQKQNAAIGWNLPPEHWINENCLSGYLSVLNEFDGSDHGDRPFNGSHYIHLEHGSLSRLLG